MGRFPDGSSSLRRRGLSRAAITELKAAFHDVYFTPGNIRDVAAALLAGLPPPADDLAPIRRISKKLEAGMLLVEGIREGAVARDKVVAMLAETAAS